ncbi:hypothetical protein LCGC14_1269400 [marine sediment metagenome]|uniref:Uncharacterized protein n=1 Tax=marine sediment metagenome TaxID=412755 RepID=A0A0F9L0E0_9ZZZZ
MTDSRTPSDLVTEAISDLRQALEDLEHCAACREHPKVWDVAGDLAQGAAGLLSDAAKMKRGES